MSERKSDPRAPENLVNLEKYPLDDPDSPRAEAVLDRLREGLERDGAVSLPGFLTPEGLSLLADEGNALAPLAYPGPSEASPYFFNYDLITSDDPTHPVRRKNTRRLAQVATDLIPHESGLWRLFQWDAVPAFLAKALGYPKLYPAADRYQSLNISVMGEGGCQQWHFDSSPFVTTLLLQAPESGGDFEYVPNLREDDDEHFDEVRRIMDGETNRIRRIEIQPGMLNLFKGHYSMHRVTPVQGPRRRIQSILAYRDAPDKHGSLKSSILHYGPRVAIKEGMLPMERDAMLAG